ncbi:MAG: RNB domain-containing ribonuclease [Oligoflexia bacterium]|nr:RNB domain-containing ribonuclease [Oligoflexia bacterium]
MSNHHRSILQKVAYQAMVERDLLPEFSQRVFQEIAQIKNLQNSPREFNQTFVDLRQLAWCSIDNDDSSDLDQLTVALPEASKDGVVKILVAIADVDFFVKKASAIDDHARANTTSIYTAAEIFPMLPLELSTNLTSLNAHQDRDAMVIEMEINLHGKIVSSNIYPGLVHNHAKLTYNSIGPWLEKQGPTPEATAVILENLRLQDRVAQLLRKNRYEQGALDLETIQARPVFHGDILQDLEVERKNRAKELIEDFMVAANSVTAKFLKKRGFASLRRVVRSPKRWDRIVAEAENYNYELPLKANSEALADFLRKQRALDPVTFPDLSLTIIKLLGRGEYVLELPDGDQEIGHFGLAVENYTHSTAPNRRFPDLITQRLLKFALKLESNSYSVEELSQLASHCTQREDDANKVERRVAKSAGALLLSSRHGELFDAICTGAADKGTWVRIFHPPIEGRLLYGFEAVDVGDKLQVKLIHTDVTRGYIDFKRV